MTTRFAEALTVYGLERCLINETTLWIGVDGSKDTPNFSRVPSNPPWRRKIEFLAAPGQADLVAALLASPEAEVIEELFIGTYPHYPKHPDFSGYDTVAAVAALAGADLPALRHLDLGDMQNWYGGQRLFGTVGDIAHVFAAAPAMTSLNIGGSFSLSRPIAHERLETLSTKFDDFGVTGEPITQATLDNLLTSRFPSLKSLELDMDEGGGDETLTLPEAFFAAGHLQALQWLDIDRLLPEAEDRLAAYKTERGLS